MPTLTDEQIAAQAKRELDAANERLYEVFAKYELKEHVDGCPHCVHDEDHKLIHSKPLRQLSSGDLDRYAFKSLYTWGDEEDFKHFLPRLLEITANEGFSSATPDLLFRKIRFTDLLDPEDSWPEEEQISIDEYLTTIWNHELSYARKTYSATADYLRVKLLLVGIGGVKDDLRKFLQTWQNFTNLKAIATLSEFLENNLDQLNRYGASEHLGIPDAPLKSIFTWLKNKATLTTLKEKVAKESNEEKREYLSKSIELLEIFLSLQNT